MSAREGRGFLLTRGSCDQADTTEIQLWLASDDGPVLLRAANQKPVFFIQQAAQQHAARAFAKERLNIEIKPLAMRDFAHQSVCGVYARTLRLHYRARDLLADAGVTMYETDIRLHDRFLMERFICGGARFTGRAQQRDGYVEYTDVKLKACDYAAQIKMLSLDIECDDDGALFCVGLVGCDAEETLMLGAPQAAAQNILWFENERALLAGLVARIQKLDPDAIIGWNLINFDLRILLARAARHRVAFNIGRGRRPATWRDLRGEKEKGFISIPGRVAIDGIDALKTATYAFASFSLESVARELLARGKKVEHDVGDRFDEIKYNFHNDKPKLAAYNIEDCKLVADIFAHTQLIDFLRLRSQMTGLEIDRVGGSVAAFTNLYLPKLHRAGFVAPNLPDDAGLSNPGGYVMDSAPGLYRNVLVLDFKSLYPAIIRTFRIDPLGLIHGLREDDAIAGFCGGKFSRERHFLPQIIADLWRQRDLAKQQKDAPRSQAIKILMNSFYGVLGAGGCRFYDARLASSITLRGHEIMQTTRKWIEASGARVIYGDTDSLFVWIEGEPTPAACRQTGNALVADINQKWRDKIKEEFDLPCFLELEFETHFARFLMPRIRGAEAGSKKRYAGLIQARDADKAREQIVFKGLENVRTDWTPLAREFQAGLYDLIFHDRDPAAFIKQTAADTLAGKLDDKLVYRKQLRRKLGDYVKNIPPHVKAARLADEENRKLGKKLRYQQRGWISYVITRRGPEAIEHRANAIDYSHYVERQLKPVADAILPFVDLDFDSITGAQEKLF